MVNMGAMTAFTDGAASRNALGLSAAITDYVGASGVIYGLLVVNGAYTPASGETFTVTLHIER